MTKLSYSIEDATELLNISRVMIYREINAGRIKTFNVGRRRFISHRAMEEYIADREKESNPDPEAV